MRSQCQSVEPPSPLRIQDGTGWDRDSEQQDIDIDIMKAASAGLLARDRRARSATATSSSSSSLQLADHGDSEGDSDDLDLDGNLLLVNSGSSTLTDQSSINTGDLLNENERNIIQRRPSISHPSSPVPTAHHAYSITTSTTGCLSQPPSSANLYPGAKLPQELREMIVSHLDREPYTLFNLMLASKDWYNTLCTGVKAQRDWKRRIRLLPLNRHGLVLTSTGSARNLKRHRTASGKEALAGAANDDDSLTSAKKSYIRALKDVCIMCLSGHMPQLHGLVRPDDGPSWIKLCEDCATRPGPLQIIDRRTAIWAYLLDENDLDTLPKAWIRPGDYWGPRYLKRYVVDLEASLIRKLRASEQVAASWETSMFIDMALGSIKCERIWPIPSSLEARIRGLLHSPRVQEEDIETTIDYYVNMLSTTSAVETALQARGSISDQTTRPSLYHEYQTGSGVTWLDILVQGGKQVDEYIDAVLQYDKKYRRAFPQRLIGNNGKSKIKMASS